MNYMKRISLMLTLIAAFLALPAWARKLETDYDHAVNFSQYHTYSWGRVHTLGAKKVIVTGRNVEQLEALRRTGADVVIPFDLRPENPQGIEEFEKYLRAEFVHGLDVVIDYLWGTSARTVIDAVAKSVEDAHPVRFVHVGEASREPVELPGAALRFSAIQTMGSGLKSVPLPKLLEAVRQHSILRHKTSLTSPRSYFSAKEVPLRRLQSTRCRCSIGCGT
jgi:hypothetical protein